MNLYEPIGRRTIHQGRLLLCLERPILLPLQPRGMKIIHLEPTSLAQMAKHSFGLGGLGRGLGLVFSRLGL
jgi:hypothetical protein